MEHTNCKHDSVVVLHGDFFYAHTSGHATTKDLQRLVEALQPKKIVPVHTTCPESYAAVFKQAGHGGARWNADPYLNAVLVEKAFISNLKERELLTDTRLQRQLRWLLHKG